jgi:ClpP class serine protease
MTSSLSRIAAMRFFNTPLAIHAGKLATALEALGPRLAPDGLVVEGAPEPVDHVAFAGGRPSMGRLGNPLGARIVAQREGKPYAMVGSLAIIAIEGTLIHKGRWVGASSGVTTYEGIHAAVRAAAEDRDVKGVLFEVDSFGGEAAGAFDAAKSIRLLSEAKSTLAILTDYALSAGYLLASAARRVSMPASGRAGSIGMAMVHTDYSGAIANQGLKVTVLTAGKFKGEGNPYEPLGVETAARLRADLEAGRRDLAKAVHFGRGKRLSIDQALATEADDFRGEDAARLGLVDRVEHPSDAFDAFAAQINGRATRSAVGVKSRAAAPGAATPSAVAPEADVAAEASRLAQGERVAGFDDLDSALDALAAVTDQGAAQARGYALGKAEGMAEGAAGAAARIKAILGSGAAKPRRALADKLAFDTDLSVEQALEILSASPAEAALGRLAREMASYRPPNLGSGVAADRVDPPSEFEMGAAAARELLGLKPPVESGPSRFSVNR